ncbi:putative transcriptional regulator NrdR [Gardnerella vaginalis]|uniref:Transcriptional repressor NrdR n=2 Tax=Bifidobacteriaceae TaxID=31953 RepID=A0A135Z5E5_GARVA|nr:putative transcriptional regulator NrdR [Gardnerella vaginalis]
MCGNRFTTVETTQLLVMKRSGSVEPFDRSKVVAGVSKACQGRPIDSEALKTLGMRVEADLRARGLAQVTSEEVGKAILQPLRELDEVAYLRFASVYQNFTGLKDFEKAIEDLKQNKSSAQS